MVGNRERPAWRAAVRARLMIESDDDCTFIDACLGSVEQQIEEACRIRIGSTVRTTGCSGSRVSTGQCRLSVWRNSRTVSSITCAMGVGMLSKQETLENRSMD